jgi:hypothetical protein
MDFLRVWHRVGHSKQKCEAQCSCGFQGSIRIPPSPPRCKEKSHRQVAFFVSALASYSHHIRHAVRVSISDTLTVKMSSVNAIRCRPKCATERFCATAPAPSNMSVK